MTYLLGGGWWTLWYLLLWISAAPFMWLAVPLSRTPLAGTSSGLDIAFAICNVGLVLLLPTSLVSTLFWVTSNPASSGLTRFVWPLVIYLVVAVAAAGCLYALLYYITAYAATSPRRWGGYVTLLIGVLVVHGFALQAVWRFRQSR